MNHTYKIICKYHSFDEFLSIFELQMPKKKIVPMYSYNFLITIRITYEELCIKFSSILIGPKKFYEHFKNIFLEKLKISVIYK
ncbi:hypothetical protein FWK35_00017584 [Aphis craccivora]|uniref:Uncharacterized protein n=1 Tax=Aphis craccivora TaxID=307492 RepID=A0A6G0YDI8_APHCR|nr:hypothetical protein FWK35_00017584 [Aphis craccivora]